LVRAPRLPHGEVIQDPDRLAGLRRDESHLVGDLPAALALPRSAADLKALGDWAKGEGGGLVPRGAGSGKAGGCLARAQDVIVDLTAWPRTLEVRPSDLCLGASANVLLHEVKSAAEARGLFYPPDPNSWQVCGFGGSLATNAGGPNACKYGMTRHWVLEVEALLADGDLHRFGIASVKANAGPNLAQLLVGSEGIFGLITGATVRLAPRPASRLTLLLPVDDFHGLLDLPGLLCAGGLLPCAFEFWDPAVLRELREHGPEEARRLPGEALALLEFDDRDCATDAFMERLLDLLGPLAEHLQSATEARQREALWQVRRMTSVFLKERHPKKVSEDLVVPRSRLADFFAALQASGIPAVTYGHLGDGNLHVNLLAAGETAPGALERQLMDLFRMSVDLGGTLSGEHGIGLAKRDALREFTPSADMAAWRAVKAALDPQNIFNPGKVL
jgi:FAD/FMN-containing dehydrogenase